MHQSVRRDPAKLRKFYRQFVEIEAACAVSKRLPAPHAEGLIDIAAIQMLYVPFPATDGRALILNRYTGRRPKAYGQATQARRLPPPRDARWRLARQQRAS